MGEGGHEHSIELPLGLPFAGPPLARPLRSRPPRPAAWVGERHIGIRGVRIVLTQAAADRTANREGARIAGIHVAGSARSDPGGGRDLCTGRLDPTRIESF